MADGWIKLHRSLLEWGWWDDANTTRLWLYILLTANHKQKEWHGVTIKAGQLLTGRKALSEATGLSERNIRTSLSKLESTGEITLKTTNKFTVITVIKWAQFQLSNNGSDQQTTNNRPTTDQQVTTTKKEKNVRNKEYVNTVRYDVPVYILQQMSGTLPPETPADADDIERIRKLLNDKSGNNRGQIN